MSQAAIAYVARRASVGARVLDFVELTKPRIAAMVLVTVAVSSAVGCWGRPPLGVVVHTLIGTALIAASASALNQWLERASDAMMDRTARRPMPARRLTSREVLSFGALSVIAGSVYLVATVNVLTALLGLLTWFLYVVVYTPLKQRTSANTFVGAIAGALPVLMGWAAVEAPFGISGSGLDGGIRVASLFLIVYLWQFPHFMAIAWIYRRQYGAAGLQMLTVVDPTGKRAGAQALWGALALVPISLLSIAGLVSISGIVGPAFYAVTLALGLAYVLAAAVFFSRRTDGAARALLFVSLVYLPIQLGLLLVLPIT